MKKKLIAFMLVLVSSLILVGGTVLASEEPDGRRDPIVPKTVGLEEESAVEVDPFGRRDPIVPKGAEDEIEVDDTGVTVQPFGRRDPIVP